MVPAQSLGVFATGVQVLAGKQVMMGEAFSRAIVYGMETAITAFSSSTLQCTAEHQTHLSPERLSSNRSRIYLFAICLACEPEGVAAIGPSQKVSSLGVSCPGYVLPNKVCVSVS